MTDLYRHNSAAPAPLPASARDADGNRVSNLAALDAPALAALGFVLADEKPYFDPSTQTVRWDGAAEDWVVEDLPVPEPVEPQPKVLGKLEFIGLVQAAGGMTDAQLTTAYKDPQLEAFWVKYQMASSVERDHPVTSQALAALDGLAYTPNGADAVLSAWPTV